VETIVRCIAAATSFDTTDGAEYDSGHIQSGA
jgi:hypothetical protein